MTVPLPTGTSPSPDSEPGPIASGAARSVLQNSGFLRLWAAQVVSQTAQNGLMFALLVLVTERTGSSVNGSASSTPG